MKNAYVSLVITAPLFPAVENLAAIDEVLAAQTQMHEIIVVAPHGLVAKDYGDLVHRGPLTVVVTHPRVSEDEALVAGLGRAVGDFIIDWRGGLDKFDCDLIGMMLEPVDRGSEVVEILGRDPAITNRLFVRLANQFRPRDVPVQTTVGRMFSRRALNDLLAATPYEPHVAVVVAELPTARTRLRTNLKVTNGGSTPKRFSEGLGLLSRGTRFGTVLPLGLAALSAGLIVTSAIYALANFLLSGRAPSGWTVGIVVLGLGQTAILSMLALTWSRIDALSRGLSKDRDSTAEVTVWAPNHPA